MSFSGEEIRDIYFWLLGGLVAQGWRSVEVVGRSCARGGRRCSSRTT